MGIEDQGISDRRYRVIPRTLIFIFDREHVLLIKGAPDKSIWANCYNGIGGHVEPGEDVLSAAKRELIEETGISDIDLRPAGIIHVLGNENTGVLVFVFWGIYNQEPIINSKEGELEWILADEVSELPVVEDIPFIIPKVIQCHRNGDIFSARSYYDASNKMVIEFS